MIRVSNFQVYLSEKTQNFTQVAYPVFTCLLFLPSAYFIVYYLENSHLLCFYNLIETQN